MLQTLSTSPCVGRISDASSWMNTLVLASSAGRDCVGSCDAIWKASNQSHWSDFLQVPNLEQSGRCLITLVQGPSSLPYLRRFIGDRRSDLGSVQQAVVRNPQRIVDSICKIVRASLRRSFKVPVCQSEVHENHGETYSSGGQMAKQYSGSRSLHLLQPRVQSSDERPHEDCGRTRES
jgi:hypothetical protein